MLNRVLRFRPTFLRCCRAVYEWLDLGVHNDRPLRGDWDARKTSSVRCPSGPRQKLAAGRNRATVARGIAQFTERWLNLAPESNVIAANCIRRPDI